MKYAMITVKTVTKNNEKLIATYRCGKPWFLNWNESIAKELEYIKKELGEEIVVIGFWKL